MYRSIASALILAALSLPCAADVVWTKDGRRIEGQVIDLGAEVEVVRPLGRIRIRRSEIASIEVTGAAEAGAGEASAASKVDVVILKSGKAVSGRVRVDGREVLVDFGERGTIRIPRSEVKSIVWADPAGSGADTESAAASALASTVDALMADLTSGDPSRSATARARLLELDVFAIPDLERHVLAATDPTAVADVIRRIRFRGTVHPELRKAHPDLEQRVFGADPSERLEVVRDLLLHAREDAPEVAEEVLDFMVRLEDQDPDVRAAIIEGLRRGNRNKALLHLLSDGPASVRLGAAVALGDNGVLVGIPILIEALHMDSLEIRRLAIGRLERYTGEFLDFFPEDPREQRDAAVLKWEEWWQAHGEEVVSQSLRGTLRTDEITDVDRQEARKFWVLAHEFWDRAELPEAAPEQSERDLATAVFYLREALQVDPTFVVARINLAVVLYASGADEQAWESAERELRAVLQRTLDDPPGASARHLALYHLGRLYMQWGRWKAAVVVLRDAVRSADAEVSTWIALGDACLGRALQDPSLQAEDVAPAERGALVVSAREAFQEALAAADRQGRVLAQTERDNERLALEDPVRRFTSGEFRGAIRSYGQHLDQQRAAAHYGIGSARVVEQDLAGAVAAFEQACALHPDHEVYRQDLEWWAGALEVPEASMESVPDSEESPEPYGPPRPPGG